MLNRILLFVLRRRLKRYKRDAKPYEKIGNYNNWYHEWGIPEVKNQIAQVEAEIEFEKMIKRLMKK